MPRPMPVDYLQPDERRMLEAGRHPVSVVDDWLAGLFAVLLVGAGVWAATRVWRPVLWVPVGVPALVLLAGLLVAFVVARWWRVLTSHYVLTDERVYATHGRLRFFLALTTYDKVTDLHVRQSVWGRMAGFGTVRIETAGSGVVVAGVRDPFAFKQRVEAARSAFLRRLVEQHVPEAVRTDVPEPADDLVWTGGPSLASLLGGIATSAFFGLFALAGFTAGEAGSQAFVLALAATAFVAWSLFTVWVRFRFTRYQVLGGGVVVTSGWLTRRRVETRYEKVTDVTVYQGFLGRLFGYGNITVNTAGSNQAPVVFQGLADPEGVKALIDGARA